MLKALNSPGHLSWGLEPNRHATYNSGSWGKSLAAFDRQSAGTKLKSRTANVSLARHFARSLDRKIQKAIGRAFNAALQQRPAGESISLELFICSLYVVFGKRFLRQFDNQSAVLQMRREILPEDNPALLQPHLKGQRRFPEEISWVFVSYEDRLTRVLWNAIRISKALGRHSVRLPELMAAVCLDDEAVRHLKEKRGFMPLGFLEALPPPASRDRQD